MRTWIHRTITSTAVSIVTGGGMTATAVLQQGGSGPPVIAAPPPAVAPPGPVTSHPSPRASRSAPPPSLVPQPSANAPALPPQVLSEQETPDTVIPSVPVTVVQPPPGSSPAPTPAPTTARPACVIGVRLLAVGACVKETP